MRKIFLIILLFFSQYSNAKGVKAGTIIKNRATLSYTFSKKRYTIKSNQAKSVVDQIVDVALSWMDTAPVNVSSNENDSLLRFQIVNSGNGFDRFRLFAKKLKYKSHFQIKKIKLYVDTNKNGVFDSEDHPQKTIKLKADEKRFIFLSSKIAQNRKVANRSLSYIELKAVSKLGGSSKPGTIYRAKGIKGVDVIDGLSGGVAEVEGSYKFLKAKVRLKKRVYLDKNGDIVVKLSLLVEGRGRVRRVKIRDLIPKKTRYIKNSILLDNKALTDRKDSDEAYYKRARKRALAKIFFHLGDLVAGDSHEIEYRLRIKEEKR